LIRQVIQPLKLRVYPSEINISNSKHHDIKHEHPKNKGLRGESLELFLKLPIPAREDSMRVLFNAVHPAQILDTKNVYLKLKEKGHQVRYAARDREVMIALLDSFDADYVVISKKGSFFREAFVMLFGLLKQIILFKPDYIIAVGGSLAPFAGWVTRTRTLHWSDSENSLMMNFLSHPWTTKSLTSRSYRMGYRFSGFLKNKRILHNSLFQLAYCGPGYFQPDERFKKKLGLGDETSLYFMRLGNFDSYHDINVPQPSKDLLTTLCNFLAEKGRLEISFEGTPPTELEKYKMTLPPSTMQQYIHHADLVFSQGACTASESAILGTPCVFQSHLDWGYIEDEIGAGILFRSGPEGIMDACMNHLNRKHDPDFQKRVTEFLRDKEDLVELTLQIVEDPRFWSTKGAIDPTLPPFNLDLKFNQLGDR
jgi:uncharacterized protein